MLMLLLVAFPLRGTRGDVRLRSRGRIRPFYASLRRLECRADSGDCRKPSTTGCGPSGAGTPQALCCFMGNLRRPDHAPAQNYLGYRLFNGEGVERDASGAPDLIEKAAMQGDAKGAANLGWLLAAGEGVEQDPEKAVYWLGKSRRHRGFRWP